jgi:hypothetical protein
VPSPTPVWLHPSSGAIAHSGAISSLPTTFRLVSDPKKAKIVVLPVDLARDDSYQFDVDCELVLTDVYSASRAQLDAAREARECVRIGEPSLIVAADLMQHCADAYTSVEPTIMEVTIETPTRTSASARVAELVGVVAALAVPVDTKWTITATSRAVAATALWRDNTLAVTHRGGLDQSGSIDVSISSMQERIIARGYFGGSARPGTLVRQDADGQVEGRPTFASPIRRYWMSGRDGLWPEANAAVSGTGLLVG